MSMSTMFTFLHIIFSFFFLSSAARVGFNYNAHRAMQSSVNWINVASYGAKGDGKTDATQAFLDAWNAACASVIPSQILVPKGEYLLHPLRFEGASCKSSILFKIDGTLVGPDNYDELANVDSWIVFHQANRLYIKGGTLDAKGKYLWDCKASGNNCPRGARSLSFSSSHNIIVEGLTSINSQMFHITLNSARNIHMERIKVTAPGDSPNTDGIHFEQSKGVTIMNSQFQTGDDCISIGQNNQNVWIENINCGPGHGISIGSLGRSSDDGVLVRNVTVKGVNFTDTQNGLRIKTFATEVRGDVKDVYYLGATMNNVNNPIIIDQNYCPHNTCPGGQGSSIQIDNVIYKDIHGTSSSKQALMFDCSAKTPCMELTLQDVNLSYNSNIAECKCNHASGKILGDVQPSNCLNCV